MAAACTPFGVTAIVPTLTVLSDENWRISSRAVRDAMEMNGAGAHILGIHMEGPFLSLKNKGGIFGGGLAQPSNEILDKCFDFCGDALRIMTLAPELEGATAVIERLLDRGVVVSVGHSGASYEQAAAAFRQGCRHVAHLFNGMPGIASRDPGVVAAALLDDTVAVELIADGHHVAAPNILAVMRVKPREKICLVTDACKACGTNLTGFDNPSGFRVEIRDGRTWGPDDKLVGSVLTLDQALRNVLAWSPLSLNDALAFLTENPARQLGLYPQKGEIAVGSDADLVLLDNNLHVARTFVGGQLRYTRDAA
jgi:N-acetylglucosamine-6-phosphate deacetylase